MISTMDANPRKSRLKQLVSDAESISAFARKYGFDPTYISQMLHGHRNIGEKTARKIEQATGKPLGWLDDVGASATIEPAGTPRYMRQVPIKGMARLGDDGYYEDIEQDGWVESYSPDPQAYGIRVKGDSMHPAIRNGAIVVVEPSGACIPMEYVAIALTSGQKMVKELVAQRELDVVVESVNGNLRQTIERADILQMHPVAAVVSASKWRST